MSKPPGKIWISIPYGRHAEDWNFTDNPELVKEGDVEYVPAATLLELEAERDRLLQATPLLLPSNTPDMPYTVGWNDCVRWLHLARAELENANE